MITGRIFLAIDLPQKWKKRGSFDPRFANYLKRAD